jgi:hypothetical protein
MNQKELRRLVNKSDRQLFINDLITGFGLSKVEAEALCARITRFNRVTTKVLEDRVRKRKQLSLWENKRASLYCIAELKKGIRHCGCVTQR